MTARIHQITNVSNGRLIPQSASEAAGAGPAPRFLTTSMASEVGILLALSLMFPFLIHILPVPEDARLGPRLLPMFYAPLLGALLGRTRSALIVAVVAPWLNWALTSHPIPPIAFVMTLQLLTFVGVLRALLARLGSRWFLAAPAYVGCVMVGALTVALFPGLIGGRAPMPWAAQGFVASWPGLVALVLINWLATRFGPTDRSGGGPAAVIPRNPGHL
ncbi:MAG: hypothetical protein EXS38_08280 [Opitutus sp.]|nr:hypothetical protein [Opitutus sp.]